MTWRSLPLAETARTRPDNKDEYIYKACLQEPMMTDDAACDEDEPSAWLGRWCAQCLMNHIDIPMFFISFLVLYLSIDRCCYCVLLVALVSAFMCIRFPILNATLWSALIVLYLHKNWNINFGDVKVSWNRAT